jgi:hypothetical protein
MNEKIKSEFSFSTVYVDDENREQVAAITLHINYRTRSYDIVSCYGNNGHFVFKGNSHQWKMWKAVVQSIEEAIDFANKEINNIGVEDLPDAPPVLNFNPMAGVVEPILHSKQPIINPAEIPNDIPEPEYRKQ